MVCPYPLLFAFLNFIGDKLSVVLDEKSSSHSSVINILDARTRNVIKQFSTGNHTHTMSFYEDKNYESIVTRSSNGEIELWDITKGELRSMFCLQEILHGLIDASRYNLLKNKIAQDQYSMYTFHRDIGEGYIKSTERSKPSTNSGVNDGDADRIVTSDFIRSVSFTPDGHRIAVNFQDINICICEWGGNSKAPIYYTVIPSPSCVENALHFSGDDSVLVAKFMTGSQVWDINTGRTIISLNDQAQFNGLSLSHDRKLLGGLESNNMII